MGSTGMTVHLLFLLVSVSLSLLPSWASQLCSGVWEVDTTDYSYGSDYIWFGRVQDVEECQEGCRLTFDCVGVSIYRGTNCVMYGKTGIKEGSQNKGWISYKCKLETSSRKSTCVDDNGFVRDQGETWRKDCNICRCSQGGVSCTQVSCDDIGGDKHCECTHPVPGGNYQHTGDWKMTCSRKRSPYCFVDCASNCEDIIAVQTHTPTHTACLSQIACFDLSFLPTIFNLPLLSSVPDLPPVTEPSIA